MGSFKCWYRRTRLFLRVLTRLNCLFQEETSVRMNVIDACIRTSLPVTRRDPRLNLLLPNGTRSTEKHAHSIHFYTNARVLIPVVTFYDAKPQSVKIPISAKPSGISPNHTCQCSLVLLSYNISPSHFSLQTTFKQVDVLPSSHHCEVHCGGRKSGMS